MEQEWEEKKDWEGQVIPRKPPTLFYGSMLIGMGIIFLFGILLEEVPSPRKTHLLFDENILPNLI